MADIATTPSGNESEVIHADFTKNAGVDLLGYIGGLSEPGQKWDWSTIDGELWSKSFPYQLAILEAQADGSYSVYRDLVYTLPINPEDLTNVLPFASTVSASLGGVVEQHGGTPFRMISFSGTFGVLPMRTDGTGQLWAQKVATTGGSLLGGLLSNVSEAGSRATSSARAAVNGGDPMPNTYHDGEVDTNGTGYFQYRQLQRFLETYAEAKMQGWDELRLALLIWKEQACYIVQPKVFQVGKNAGSPHEYRYTLQFQAWKRINPQDIGYGAMAESRAVTATARKASFIKSALARLDTARKTLRGVRSVAGAIGTDFDVTVGQAMSNAILLLKDLSGVVKTAADFPQKTREHIAEAAEGWWDSAKSVLPRTDPAQVATIQALDQVQQDRRTGAGYDKKAVASILGNEDNAWLTEAIEPDNIDLPANVQAQFDEQTQAVSTLTKTDFQESHRMTLAFLANYADRVGLGSRTYNDTLGLPTAEQVRDPIDEDYVVLQALTDTASTFATMATYSDSIQPRTPSTIEYVAGVANAAGIRMRVPRSKFAVPFPYGSTLERVAQQYLGDADRWYELAALNDLRTPYVDEVGQELPLLVPGKGNEVVVQDASRLVVGQQVTIYSNVRAPVIRRVLDASQTVPGYWVVTLSGEPNLNLAKPAEGARLHWFGAYTVNSRQVIYIPSDQPSSIEDTGQYVPTVEDLDRLLQVGDVDGMLDSKGDIVITADGDWPFVFGLQSIIQWTRTALSTPRGSMPLHPSFGIPAMAGMSLADLSANDIMRSVQGLFRNGPAYTGVRAVAVEQMGPVARVSFELGVRGADVHIPLSFDVPRS